jgi:hypothetical protein
MDEYKPPVAIRTGTCGCEGLACWECGRPIIKGIRYMTVGITRLCWECVSVAMREWVRNGTYARLAQHGGSIEANLEERFSEARRQELLSPVRHPDNSVEGDIIPHGERNGR